MDLKSNIYVAGHRGLVGSSIVRALEFHGYKNILKVPHSELDLTQSNEVDKFFKENKIDYVFLSAAKVGGIIYNAKFQADFLFDNLAISANVIKAAANNNVKKLLYLGSSCIYPKHAPQPIKEEYLLTGPLEPTNEGYAIAKIAGLKLCEKYREQYNRDFISVMPTNLYGPFDNFHPEHSHVIPGLIRRFHYAKINKDKNVIIWGTGTPRREFLYVEDLANALVKVMNLDSDLVYKPGTVSTINVGTGKDISILDLATQIKDVVGFEGEIVCDASKPDGTPRKVLDVSRITNLGWQPKVSLAEGLRTVYDWALSNGSFV